jgi:hypothetical protein
MIRLISYSLLLSFFVLLTPRDVWHDCHHDDHHHEIEQSSETHAEQDDCFACDFDLGFYTFSSPYFFSLNQRFNYENPKRILSRLNDFEGFSFSLRGPPVTA